jgi:hemolysin activation/secretion protein
MEALAFAGQAAAQRAPAPAAPPPTREELNPASRATPTAPSTRELFAPEATGPCPLRNSTDEFELKSVTLQGLTAAKEADLAAAYRDKLGKRIPVGAICDVRDAVTRALFDRGVLARVDIPQQTIANGQLTLDVVEAHVVNVRIRGDAGPAQAAVERYLDHLRGMSPFNMRKAERYLLLAADVPGVTLHAAVGPSSNGERGAIDFDVRVERQAYDALANVQNLGAKDLGQWGGMVRGDINSVTAFGDKSELVFYHSLANDQQLVVQAAEEARFGGDGLIGRLSFAYGDAHPGGVFAPIDLVSKSYVTEAELGYPIIRMRRLNLNVAGGIDAVDQFTDTAGVNQFADRLRVLYLRADGNQQTSVAGRPVALTGSIQLRKGIDGLGSSSPGSLEISRQGGSPDAWVVRGSASAQAPLFDKFSLSAQVIAQYSAERLLPYEQITYGNLTVGRGYDPGVVGGDSGAGGELALRYGTIAPHPQVLLAPYAFYDYGYAHRQDLTQQNAHLESAGLGMQMRLFRRVNLDIAYAWPLLQPQTGGLNQSSRLLFNLTTTLR